MTDATNTGPMTTQPAHLRERILALAEGGFVPTEELHWIGGVENIGGYGDEADAYCFSCCTKKVAEILAAHPNAKDEYGILVDGGGWGGPEDGPRFCTTCEVQLDVTLTDEGVGSEIEHFNMSAPTTADEWMGIARMTASWQENDERWSAVARWLPREPTGHEPAERSPEGTAS